MTVSVCLGPYCVRERSFVECAIKYPAEEAAEDPGVEASMAKRPWESGGDGAGNKRAALCGFV